ncbi:GMC family oxidoreductase [Pseudomonas indica]|uniref:GMC family oxidoreductase n=1 Tax=Pseudomonas indica TaxID=137658 RepID=UPI000BAB3BFC|nr:GMC family oxidoreductase [Pseudomonas indica]PAU63006.1 choline dehydrogenase [Pseudomonas indica]
MADSDYADYVVIGAGLAGGMIAHRLAESGKDVLLLEAGPRLSRWEILERFRNQPDKTDFQAPYPATEHAPHPMIHVNNGYLIQKGDHPYNVQYLRLVGGTTWHWAAATWRFLPSDFKLKSLYGVGLDWPIGYEDLEPWYAQAEAEMGVWGPNDEDLGSPRSGPYPMEPLPLSYNDRRIKEVLNAHGFRVVTEPVARNSRPYDERPTCCGNNNCMPLCPIGAMYNGIMHVEKAEKAGARLIANAVVHGLERDDRQRIRAALYKDPAGAEHRVEGKVFVLAANGVETAKLMLMAGVGNRSGLVGRNLMDHPGTGVSFFADEPLWAGRGPQEMTSLVDFRDGPFRSEFAAKKIHPSNLSRLDEVTLGELRNGPLRFGKALEDRIRDRTARFVRLDSFHEILPRPENRIVPSATEKDALGIPKPEFTYALDDYVRRSAAHTREVYAAAAQALGGSEVRFHDDYANNNHIAGTTLMGDDPTTSVVDAGCRSHDHPNLFIAGGSVMPTVGTVNISLTIAALALRLAESLKGEV